MTKKRGMPQEILVYRCDIDDVNGEPLFAVACNVEEIPEDADGGKVGIYTLNRVDTFRVRRELK